MRRVALFLAACVAVVSAIGLYAQQADLIGSTNNAAGVLQSVPRLIMFSGAVKDLTGKPLTGPVDLNFAIYKEQTDAAPLWQESQTLNVDEQGHYTALLGAMQPEGLPVDLFTSGEARWLGVSAGKLPEQPRVLLVSVPYALKANDAEMLAGKPASAYALAQPTGASTSAGATAPGGAAAPDVAAPGKPKSGPKPNLTGTGTKNYLPVWTDSAGTLGNSVIYQSSGLVGIGTTTPAARLDVAGSVGHFLVDTSGAQFRFTRGGANYFLASTAGGYFDFVANGLTPSDANASLKLAANGVVNFMAGNVGIGTLTPVAKLEVNGTTKFDGAVTFASGQTFPGTGTVTNIATGAGLTGGPITTSGTISIPSGGVSNSMLAHPSLTINTNSGLTGGGQVFLGENLTLGMVANACSPGMAVTALPGPSCQGFASFGSNYFSGSQNINVSGGNGLFVSNTGGGTAIQATSSAGPKNGVAAYFMNTNGGSILEANDGNHSILRADTNGADIRRTVGYFTNDPVNATVLYELVTTNQSTGNAKLAGPGYSGAGLFAAGIAIAQVGTSVQYPETIAAMSGETQCVFDNTAVNFDFVQVSPTTAGLCHDAGPNYPRVGQVLGVINDTTQSPPGVYLFGVGTGVETGMISTNANCSSSASPAVCGAAGAGSVAIASATTTLVVDTSAVTAKSQIMLQEDSSLGTRLSVTCNTTAGRTYTVSARTAGTSFTIATSSAPATNPACLSYVIVN